MFTKTTAMDDSGLRLDEAIKKVKETLKPFNEYNKGKKTFKEMVTDIHLIGQLAKLDEIVEFLKKHPGRCMDYEVQTALNDRFGVKPPIMEVHKYLKMLELHGFVDIYEASMYSISMKAVFEQTFSSYYKKMKEQESIDYNLKKISLGSIRFNKYFPMAAILVAIIAIVSPIAVKVFWRESVSTYKLHEEQMQLLLKYQESQNKLYQQIHLDLNSLDTSINALRKKD